MAHGFSAVKEMYLDRFAEAFAAAGLAALVFDNRNFGASEGEPAGDRSLAAGPRLPRRDHLRRDAAARPMPRGSASGASSYSGGHVLVRRRDRPAGKCVVAQVPLISGHANARRLMRADFIAGAAAAVREDRRARMRGKAPAMVPVVAEDPLAPSALPTPDPGRGSPRPVAPARRPGGTR